MTGLLTLLVAEDDEADRFLLERALRVAHVRARVEFVRDGQEAVEFLQRSGTGTDGRGPDLVLLDLKMPRMDGFEVLNWLTEHPESRPPLVVVFSCSNRSVDMERAAELGANHYLVKPSDADELPHIVKRLEQYCRACAVACNVF